MMKDAAWKAALDRVYEVDLALEEALGAPEAQKVSDAAAAECEIEPGCWTTDLDTEALNRYADAVERRQMAN